MLDRLRVPLTLAAVVVAVIAIASFWSARPPGEPIQVPIGAVSTARPFREMRVQVAGAVVRPGVYTFAEGARIGDAIERAGGPTNLADLSRVNLAARLRDEQQVIVPAATPTAEAAPGAPSPTPAPELRLTATAQRLLISGRVNINTATADELEKVPGLGPVTSKRIVDYREKNGAYQSIEDLRRNQVIPTSTFNRARDWLTAP